MEQDSLDRLLKHADAAAPETSPVRVSADRVLGELRRQRRARRVRLGTIGAAAAVLFGAVGVVWLMTGTRPGGSHPGPMNPAPLLDVAALLEAAEALGREADSRAAVVRQTTLHETRIRALRELQRRAAATPDALALVRAQMDAAARTLVQQADRISREQDQQATATLYYREVIERFPETTWAGVARQRLTNSN